MLAQGASEAALILTIHHSLADAEAAFGLLLSLTDGTASPADREPPTPDTRAVSRLMSTPADTPTVLRGILGPVKRAALSAPLSAADVARVASTVDATSEGVALTAVTGALRSYLEDRGDLVDALGHL